jgi:hypoxanthine-DNA glycosylase
MADPRATGFAPVARPDARLLVLGTLPSARSLEAGEYYAHPRNAFWPIVERLFGREAGPEIESASRTDAALPQLTTSRRYATQSYAARTALLLQARVALWDVLRAADRPGSLDARIKAPVANDFAGFFAAHPAVHAVFFNGATARSLWERHVAPTLNGEPALRLVTLPSTSPANAAMSFETKLAAWATVREALADD